MREKLTDRFAVAVKPTARIERYFDTTERAPGGFLLRVTPAGARAWAVQYRVKDSGRQREITIGDVKSWPLAEAYKRGHALRREIDAGADPLGSREERREAATVAQLIERFNEEALSSRSPGTQREYRAMFRGWILPALGRLKVAAVSRDDVEKLHHRLTEAGKLRRANSVKSLCSALFNQAIDWKIIADNPARDIKGNAENGRERYLSEEELDRLVKVLADRRAKKPDSVDVIVMAMLTGARRGEILTMRWPDVAPLDEAAWRKPATMTKQRKAHRVPLSADAVALLRRRQAEREAGGKVVRLRDDFVFRGGGSKTATNRLERDWDVVRAAADIEDVRFHDLRHSFASLLVGEGLSLPIIGRMLGHARSGTTARYAHLADKPLREAAEIVAGKIGRRR